MGLGLIGQLALAPRHFAEAGLVGPGRDLAAAGGVNRPQGRASEDT